MAAGSYSAFVVSWAQTEIDGLAAAPVGALAIGSTWRWSGPPTRLGGDEDLLILDQPDIAQATRQRASSQLRRFLGRAGFGMHLENSEGDMEPLFQSSFELTDGQTAYRATLIEVGDAAARLLLFDGGLPPQDQDLWVVSSAIKTAPGRGSSGFGACTVCFTPGTRIQTPHGPVPVEELHEDDRICTKDNGVQPIRWIGHRRVSGGRLIAMPHLRPVRVRAHILGEGEPDADLLLSPDHRLLVKGPAAQTLFNSHEVLVAARDLINDTSILPDYRCRGVTYIHLMLDQHQIVWANGVEVDSFHPAGMSPGHLDPQQRAGLFERFPDIQQDPMDYGAFARRTLTQPEAAVLTYGVLSGH